MAISQSTSLVPCTRQPSVPSDLQSPQKCVGTDASLAGLDAPPQFKARHLTISDIRLTHESAPFIRLSGKWLAQAGFNIGDHIHVSVSPQRLVIEPAAPEVDSRSEIEAETKRRAAFAETARRDLAEATVVHPARMSTQAVGDSLAPIPRRDIRRMPQTGGEWQARIAPALEPALGDVLDAESSRLELNPEYVAALAGVSWHRYRAFTEGNNQPNLSTFVAIAWVLDQDPRELLDKLLLQMGLPPGARPVVRPVKRDSWAPLSRHQQPRFA